MEVCESKQGEALPGMRVFISSGVSEALLGVLDSTPLQALCSPTPGTRGYVPTAVSKGPARGMADTHSIHTIK